MSYFDEQFEEWFSGGIFAYAEDNGVKIKVSDLGEDEASIEKAYKRIYKKLGLNWKLRQIPGDYDQGQRVWDLSKHINSM